METSPSLQILLILLHHLVQHGTPDHARIVHAIRSHHSHHSIITIIHFSDALHVIGRILPGMLIEAVHIGDCEAQASHQLPLVESLRKERGGSAACLQVHGQARRGVAMKAPMEVM